MDLDFSKGGGLIPAVVQDASTRAVLMVGFMNEEAVRRTLETQRVTFWSRSKQRLWEKGETTGNTLDLIEMVPDCDGDTVLVLANPRGPTCHTGTASCFPVDSNGVGFLAQLFSLIVSRGRELPEGSYTTSLFKEGLEAIAAKVEEEAEEVIRAAASESNERVAEEAADVIYHLFVLLANRGVGLDDMVHVLEKRHFKK